MTDIVDNCAISPSYRSDHSIVELDIVMNNFEIGKGIWKLNVSLLKNIDYINLINNAIEEEKHKYALPVYNPDYLKNTYKNVTFTIDPDLFLEMLYLRIRGETIKFGSLLKKNNNRREKELIKDIALLELQNDPLSSSNLLDKKQELESLRAVTVQGQIVRSRMQWLSKGEKPTKFFCKMENRNYLEKNIKKLELKDGSIITQQQDILLSISDFYRNLFKRCPNSKSLQEFSLKDVSPKVSNMNLGNLLDVEEVSEALKSMKNNKTPGIDGIPADFLKVFWRQLKFFVTNAINSCYKKGILSTTLRQSVITCLPKGKKERKLLKNWRPISLLCTTYKLASSVIANRLKPHLDTIISNTQTGFLKGRSISESTRLIYDLLYWSEKNNIPGLLMAIDFEKAFDSTSWQFLYDALQLFGFDDSLIDWIKMFNKSITARVQQCGFLSEPITIERGCRQGDPIASYLFLIAAEVLSIIIK